MTTGVLAAVQLAAPSGEADKSGPIGLGIILLLCIVCYFLFKSMSKHMRRVREDFPGAADQPPTGPVRPTRASVIAALERQAGAGDAGSAATVDAAPDATPLTPPDRPASPS